MPYKVVNLWRDTEDPKDSDDNPLIYEPGEPYPREGDYEPSDERIAFLSKKHPEYNRVFIKWVEPSDDEDSNLLTKTEIKKMNKEPQEKLITSLGGDPSKAKNEDERIELILELQEENKEPSPEK
jgi:hypothetical protein